ncbi:MAG TPA: hypothetical protein VGR93_01625 [Candidatus Acidoferrales bacterium]|nr:hypothetical protein [Candidatus Acidoferrales bacterium]
MKNFGAVCDGKTDDTAAVQATYDAAAKAMYQQGGAGVVYFPPSTGYCVVTTLHIPSMGYSQGWLTSLFDNGLFVTNTIYPGNNTAFIGRTGNFAFWAPSFLWGPTAEWQKPKWGGPTSNPIVTLTGTHQVYFDGIAVADPLGIAPYLILMQNVDADGGDVTNTKFIHCSIMGNFGVIPFAPQTVVGFGLNFEDTTISGLLDIQNFGMMTYRGGYLYRAKISNVGNVNTTDFEFNDVLSEGLDQDFLTVDTSGGTVTDIILHRVRIGDPVGKVYMVKHINNTGINWLVNVKFDQIPFNCTGSGLLDPASAPELFSVVCIGSNCNQVLGEAKNTLYMFIGMPPKSPMILYGSQYIGNPLEIVH